MSSSINTNKHIILQWIITQTLILNDICVHTINKGTTRFYMEKRSKQQNIIFVF